MIFFTKLLSQIKLLVLNYHLLLIINSHKGDINKLYIKFDVTLAFRNSSSIYTFDPVSKEVTNI